MSAVACPVLAFGSDNPVDLLDNARCVASFLADVAPCTGNDNLITGGLSENGVCGLGQILRVLENTINAAKNQL